MINDSKDLKVFFIALGAALREEQVVTSKRGKPVIKTPLSWNKLLISSRKVKSNLKVFVYEAAEILLSSCCL